MGTYEWPVAGMKYIQQCTRVSGIRFLRLMLISSCRYFSYWSLMNFMMGCQLQRATDTRLGLGEGSGPPSASPLASEDA